MIDDVHWRHIVNCAWKTIGWLRWLRYIRWQTNDVGCWQILICLRWAQPPLTLQLATARALLVLCCGYKWTEATFRVQEQRFMYYLQRPETSHKLVKYVLKQLFASVNRIRVVPMCFCSVFRVFYPIIPRCCLPESRLAEKYLLHWYWRKCHMWPTALELPLCCISVSWKFGDII